MLLRRISKHVKDQNWFAVALDFFIVVVGILIAFQITNWSDGRQQRVSERNYLERLHSDIVELTERRSNYTNNRPIMTEALQSITEFVNGDLDDLSIARTKIREIFPETTTEERVESSLCHMIDWSAAMTTPPGDLPTALELLSAGRVNEVGSRTVRTNLLSFTQEVSRSEDYIGILQDQTPRLSDDFPELFTIRYDRVFKPNGIPRPKYICDFSGMKESDAFLNMLSNNNYNYAQYVFIGVLPVSERLAELHEAVDQELGIEHAAHDDTN